MCSRDVEIAWAAGLFEGEGSFRKAKTSVVATVTSTDFDVLEKFAEIVGVGRLWGPRQREAHLKPIWDWIASGDDAIAVVEAFAPHLGRRRTEQVRAVMEWRQRRIDEATAERTCPTCGKVFRPRYSSAGRNQVYCEPACRLASDSERTRRADRERQRRQRRHAGAPT